MRTDQRDMEWLRCRWTLGVTMVLVLLNFDLCFGTQGITNELARVLEFDGAAIRSGELWRLVTGNLVHFGRAHFFLDVGVFVVLGWLYESSFDRWFPWLLLIMGCAASVAGLIFWSEQAHCRGLSAIDSGLFAAALAIEWRLAMRDRWRWLWVGPATVIFFVKNAYELATGQSFFSTDRLLGPAKLAVAAHTAAIVTAFAFCSVVLILQRSSKAIDVNQSDCG